MARTKSLKPVVSALVSRCGDEDALIECMEILLPGVLNGGGVKKDRTRRRFRANLTTAEKAAIVKARKDGKSLIEVGEKYSISDSTVCRICRDARGGKKKSKKKVKAR